MSGHLVECEAQKVSAAVYEVSFLDDDFREAMHHLADWAANNLDDIAAIGSITFESHLDDPEVGYPLSAIVVVHGDTLDAVSA